MNYTLDLPEGEKLKLYYDDRVYSPKFSAVDTIVVADRLIKESKGQIKTVHDVGCGSGVLGLAIKKLNPKIKVSMSDVSDDAIKVATKNRDKLELDVKVSKSNLLKGVLKRDMVVANLPTFDDKQMATEKLHGPKQAYYGGEEPLYLYTKLFKQVRGRAMVLVCECQEERQQELLVLAGMNGLELILRTDYAFAFMVV